MKKLALLFSLALFGCSNSQEYAEVERFEGSTSVGFYIETLQNGLDLYKYDEFFYMVDGVNFYQHEIEIAYMDSECLTPFAKSTRIPQGHAVMIEGDSLIITTGIAQRDSSTYYKVVQDTCTSFYRDAANPFVTLEYIDLPKFLSDGMVTTG